MSCYISVRVCPKPNIFFDEIIPEDGLKINDWLFTLHRITSTAMNQDGEEVDVETRWIYAETYCEREKLKSTINDKRPELLQYFKSFEGFRKTALKGNVTFTFWFEEYVDEGVRGNIEPSKINVGVGILNLRELDEDGNVTFDARNFAREKALEKSRKDRERAKHKVKENSKYLKFLGDPYFRRAWECYSLAHSERDFNIGCIYDIRDAAKERFGNNARSLLGISNSDWRRMGKILNDQPVRGGRHNGLKTDPIRNATAEERTFLLTLAEKILKAFGNILESEETR